MVAFKHLMITPHISACMRMLIIPVLIFAQSSLLAVAVQLFPTLVKSRLLLGMICFQIIVQNKPSIMLRQDHFKTLATSQVILAMRPILVDRTMVQATLAAVNKSDLDDEITETENIPA
jgi:hypothetical protein